MINIKINKFALIKFLQETIICMGIKNTLKKYNELRIIIYLAGLIALNRPTTTKISQHFACISHDSLTREIDGFKWINSKSIIKYIQSIQSKTAEAGHLILDDTVLKKPYAKFIPGLWWIWDGISGKAVLGYHIVTFLWTNGKIKIPISYEIWQPKIYAQPYKSKVQLAIDIIKDIYKNGLKVDYVAFDNWYSSRKLLKVLKKCKYNWVTRLKNNRTVLYQKNFTSPKEIIKKFNENQFHYYSSLKFYVRVVQIRIKGYGGFLKMAIVKNGRSANLQNTRFILTNILSLTAQQILKIYQSRWSIEVVFRDLKQLIAFEKCQMTSWNKFVGHIEATFLTYFILDFIKNENDISTMPELVRQLKGLLELQVQGTGKFIVNTYNIAQDEINIIKTIKFTEQEQTSFCEKIFA